HNTDLHSFPTRRSSDLSFLDEEAVGYIMDLKGKKVILNLGIATSYINFYSSKNDYKNWDILQYDYDIEKSKSIYDTYPGKKHIRSEEHTSELQSPCNLV